jgi:hypothetical protein
MSWRLPIPTSSRRQVGYKGGEGKKRETISGFVKTSEVEKIRLLGGLLLLACLGVKDEMFDKRTQSKHGITWYVHLQVLNAHSK